MQGSETAGLTRDWVTVVAGLILVATTAGCSAADSGARGASSSVVTEIPRSQRKEAAPIKGRLIDGGRYDSRRLLGKIVVYNVWGSWCAPCRKEAPVLRRVSHQTRSHGVRFVGLDVRDNDTAARAFERRYKISYPSITSDDSARALLVFGGVLPANAVPSTVIVDRKGKVAARVIGRTTYAILSGLVSDVLDTATGT